VASRYTYREVPGSGYFGDLAEVEEQSLKDSLMSVTTKGEVGASGRSEKDVNYIDKL